MPFLRFTRDKRGYEQFALVHSVNRRGKSVSRVLYWYRTPPDVRVGREPFDEAMRRALETQNPDITFDWRQILETPIPSADAEKWRERRRTERFERAARQALDREDDEPGGEHTPVDDAPKHVLEVAADADAPVATLRTIESPGFVSREAVVESVAADSSETAGAQLAAPLGETETAPSEALILRQAQDERRVEEPVLRETGTGPALSETLAPRVEGPALSETQTPRVEGPALSETQGPRVEGPAPRVEGPALSETLAPRVEGPALSETQAPRVEGLRRKRRRRRGRGRSGAMPLSSSEPAVPDDTTTPAVAEGEEDAADKDE